MSYSVGQKVIAVEHLTKEYRHGKAVDDVSFEIQRGGIYGLVGPNGAGKTTIMRMLGGLVYPTEGTIALYSASGEETLEAGRKEMGFMIESPYLTKNATAYQNLEKIRILRQLPDRKVIDEVLALVGLSDVPKNKKVGKYSLGMKQRLGIACALLSKPSVLILDEPINGLDPEGIIEIRQLLLKLNQEYETTVLISSHILSELAQICTDYLFINHGKIVKQVTNEMLHEESITNLEEYYLSVMKES